MTVSWILCKDQMPFRQKIIVTLIGDLSPHTQEYSCRDSVELKENLLKLPARSRDFWKANILWTPYTPELWETLKCLLSE